MRVIYGGLVGALVMLSGCSGSSSCVVGESQVCACISGAMGAQVCGADGTFGECVCLADDGGMPMDAGVDAAGSDSGEDASMSDTPEGDTGVDAPSACPGALVSCDDTCIDPRTDPDHCGASGDCTGTNEGEVCPGACRAGRCLWDNCQVARDAGQTEDGLYLVDIDGSGPIGAHDAYCDMTTDGGGWMLVYRVRNDVPDITPAWWSVVALGTGEAFPTMPARLAAGTHFDGPTREVRDALAVRLPASQIRTTVLRASDGSVLFEVQGFVHGAMRWLVNGIPDVPSISATPALWRVTASSTGLPSVGSMGSEEFRSMEAGSTRDVDSFQLTDGSRVPLFGDASVGSDNALFANSTTLFWVRAYRAP